MTYSQALEKIHSLLTFGSRPGLDRVRELLRRMGDPQDKLKFIHVAGTNGKGSVCALLSAALVAQGYRTGLFISPYITDFRERIQINNKMIGEETLTRAVEATFPLVEQLRSEGVIITEFEYVNALEFYIHGCEGCEVVVLETGLGGLLDCTNVIRPPLCAVITTIGLDHTAILGGTVAEIAAQKCGILKEGSIAVSSAQPPEARAVIEETAARLGIPLYQSRGVAVRVKSMSLRGSRLEYRGCELSLPLAGDHQIENAKTALAAIKALNENGLLETSDSAIIEGFKNAVNPARLELLGENPAVLLDGAHNPNGAEALRRALDRFLSGRKIICLMGMLADKDADSALGLLDGAFESVYTVTVSNPRTLTASQLAEKFAPHCADVTACEGVKEGFDLAYSRAAGENAVLLVCGSLYLAGELRPYIISKIKNPAPTE